MKQLKTVLVGYGRIAAGYVNDEVMPRHIKYATHAQVLHEHPNFEWVGIIEKNVEVAKNAENNEWGIKNIVLHPSLIDDADSIDVAILATPPEAREKIIEYFPNLKAVIVEKPIGVDYQHAKNFIKICNDKKISVAVNITRRYDDKLNALSSSWIKDNIGEFQCGFGVYGNGLNNNGIHLIDLVRMLFGEINSVQAIKQDSSISESSTKFNPRFSLELESGGVINIQAINYKKYREMNLDIWGTKGRLAFCYETLMYQYFKVFDHPYATDEKALKIEDSEFNYLNLGLAQYNLYENLCSHLINNEPLLCDGKQALKTMFIIDSIKESCHTGNRVFTNDKH